MNFAIDTQLRRINNIRANNQDDIDLEVELEALREQFIRLQERVDMQGGEIRDINLKLQQIFPKHSRRSDTSTDISRTF